MIFQSLPFPRFGNGPHLPGWDPFPLFLHISGEWEDLATSNTLQWSPTLIADRQKEKERLTRLVHSRNIKTDRLLRENATWQHEKHLALTRPDLQERLSSRKASGTVPSDFSCGLFIPGKVQIRSESRGKRLNSIWFPSAPPHEVLRPLSRKTEDAMSLKRTMAVAVSPPLRPPDLELDETDAVLWCWPMEDKFKAFPVEPQRPQTTPASSRSTGKAPPVQRSGELPKDAASCRFRSFNPAVVFHEKLFSENKPLQNLSIQAAPRIKSDKRCLIRRCKLAHVGTKQQLPDRTSIQTLPG